MVHNAFQMIILNAPSYKAGVDQELQIKTYLQTQVIFRRRVGFLRESTKTQQAVVVTFYACILEVLGLNLGWTPALLTKVSRDKNMQNNNIA
jgi:hypothetical protein